MDVENLSDLDNLTFAYTENSTDSETNNLYHTAIRVVQTYFIPIIITTGCFGNSVCFIVLLASSLRRISTTVYLAALAFSDTGFLVCLAIGWMESLGIRYFHREVICQMTVFSSYVFSFTSVWFVNAFTTEMYIAVFHPQKRQTLCLPSVAKRVVCGLSIIACLIYSYVFWMTKTVPLPDSKSTVCLITQGAKRTAMVLSFVDTFLTLIIPFSMILFMSTRLFYHLSKFYGTGSENSRNSVTSDTDSINTDQTRNNHSANSRTRQQVCQIQLKLTRMLVATIIVFIVFNLPSHAIKFQFLLRSFVSDHVIFTETEGFIQIIFQTLYYANFSINFILYLVCGKSFRSAMIQLFVDFKHKYTCCKMVFGCRNILRRWRADEGRSASSFPLQGIRNQEHSRFVDIDLQDIRFSQLPSVGSQTPLKSPPCLLRVDDTEDTQC